VLGGLGAVEVVLIVFLLVILFGAKKIPLIARGLGEGIRNFRSDVKDPERLEDDHKRDRDDSDPRS
jgi:sec-independent protein translocase protein TatA